MNWKELERHPISARYKNLKGQVWKDFKDNLNVRKVRRRTITLFEGMVLDGWQLHRACVELDIKPTYEPLPDGEDPEAYVKEANDLRRHETEEEKKERIANRREEVAEMRRNGHSLPQIAEAVGVSEPTVVRDLNHARSTGVDPEPETGKTTGTDGKEYPALKPKSGPTKRSKSKSKEPKNGQIKYDWKAFNTSFGSLVREIDAFGRAYKCKECKEAEDLRTLLGSWRDRFKKWTEFHTKAPAPGVA